ncbi:hypothetical protein P7K49_002401 [Saguinus oedipus]|uniref:Uncharacterized protein n=1 Tax=Saguinus oedipus TaxID=9490 RepID=A0ABQ9WHT2_SAGOE|nr:hypothetical protein P7K49_002401 [Saguinus oedipus]
MFARAAGRSRGVPGGFPTSCASSCRLAACRRLLGAATPVLPRSPESKTNAGPRCWRLTGARLPPPPTSLLAEIKPSERLPPLLSVGSRESRGGAACSPTPALEQLLAPRARWALPTLLQPSPPADPAGRTGRGRCGEGASRRALAEAAASLKQAEALVVWWERAKAAARGEEESCLNEAQKRPRGPSELRRSRGLRGKWRGMDPSGPPCSFPAPRFWALTPCGHLGPSSLRGGGCGVLAAPASAPWPGTERLAQRPR